MASTWQVHKMAAWLLSRDKVTFIVFGRYANMVVITWLTLSIG